MAREDAWTDERLDDLNARVVGIDQRMEAGFKEIRGEFKAVRTEMRAEFIAVRSEMRADFKAVRSEIREEFQGIRNEIGELRTEMGALNRTVIQFAWAVVSTMFLGSMGTIAALIAIV